MVGKYDVLEPFFLGVHAAKRAKLEKAGDDPLENRKIRQWERVVRAKRWLINQQALRELEEQGEGAISIEAEAQEDFADYSLTAFDKAMFYETMAKLPDWFKPEAPMITWYMINKEPIIEKSGQKDIIMNRYFQTTSEAHRRGKFADVKDALNPFRANKFFYILAQANEVLGYSPFDPENPIAKTAEMLLGKGIHNVIDKKYQENVTDSWQINKYWLRAQEVIGEEKFQLIQERLFELRTMVSLKKEFGEKKEPGEPRDEWTDLTPLELSMTMAYAKLAKVIILAEKSGRKNNEIDVEQVNNLVNTILGKYDPNYPNLEIEKVKLYVGKSIFNSYSIARMSHNLDIFFGRNQTNK